MASGTPSELATSEMPVSEVGDGNEEEEAPAPKTSGFPPYPPYATEPAPPSVADTIIAGHDLRLQHKSMPRKPIRPPPKPARPRGPKATDVKMSKRALRAHARCLRKHGAILTDRLERMSKPLRRNIIYLWREHAYTLPPETIARLRAMLDADEPFKPDQAYEYFVNLKKTKKKVAATERVNEIKKDMLAMCGEKRFIWARNATVAFARGIQQRLSRPGRYALADGMLRLSNIILDEICGYMHMRTPSRRSTHPKARFMMEMSDKVAVWIDEILSESDDRMLMMDFDEDDDILGPAGGGDAGFADDFLNMMGDGGTGLLKGPRFAHLKFDGNMKKAFEILTEAMDTKGDAKLLSHGKFHQSYREAADALRQATDLRATDYNTKIADKVKKKLTAATKDITPHRVSGAMKDMVDICSNYLAQNAEYNKEKGPAFKLLVEAMKNKGNNRMYEKGRIQRTYAQAAAELERAPGLDVDHDDPNLSQQIHSEMTKLVQDITPEEMMKDMAETVDSCSKYLSQKAVDTNERGPLFDLLIRELESKGGEPFSDYPALCTRSAAAYALTSAPGLTRVTPDPTTAPEFKEALRKVVAAVTPKTMKEDMEEVIDRCGNYLSAFLRDRGAAMEALLKMMQNNPKNVFASRNNYTMDYATAADEIKNAPSLVPYLPIKDIAEEGKANLKRDMKNVTPPELKLPVQALINDVSQYLSQPVAMRSGVAGDRYAMNFLAAVKKSLGTKPLYKYKSYGQTYADAAEVLENAGPLESAISLLSRMNLQPSKQKLLSQQNLESQLKLASQSVMSQLELGQSTVDLGHEIASEMKRAVPTQLAPTIAEGLEPTMDKAAKHLAKLGTGKGKAMEYLVDLMKDKGDETLGQLQGYEQTYKDGARRLETTPTLKNEKVDKSAYEDVKGKLTAMTKDQQKPDKRIAEHLPGIVDESSKFLAAPIPETAAEKRKVLGDLMGREQDKILGKGEDDVYKMTYKEGGEEIQNAPIGVTKAKDEKKSKEIAKALEAVVPDKKLAQSLKDCIKEGAAHLADMIRGRGEAMKVIHDGLKKQKDKEFIDVGSFKKSHEEVANILTDAPNLSSDKPSPVILENVEHKVAVLPKDVPEGKTIDKKHMDDASKIAAKFIASKATKESGLNAKELAELDEAGFNAEAKAAAEAKRAAAVKGGVSNKVTEPVSVADEEVGPDGARTKGGRGKKARGTDDESRPGGTEAGAISGSGAAASKTSGAGVSADGKSPGAVTAGVTGAAAGGSYGQGGAGPGPGGPGSEHRGVDFGPTSFGRGVGTGPGGVGSGSGGVGTGPGGVGTGPGGVGAGSGGVATAPGGVATGPGGVATGSGGAGYGPGGVATGSGGAGYGPGGVATGPSGAGYGPGGVAAGPGGAGYGPGGVATGPGGAGYGPGGVAAGYGPGGVGTGPGGVGAGAGSAGYGPGGVGTGPGGAGYGPGSAGSGPIGAGYGPGGVATGPGGAGYGPGGHGYDPSSVGSGPGGVGYGPGGVGSGPAGAGYGPGGAAYGPGGIDYGPGGAGYGTGAAGFGPGADGRGRTDAGYGPSGVFGPGGTGSGAYGPGGTAYGPGGAAYGPGRAAYGPGGAAYGPGGAAYAYGTGPSKIDYSLLPGETEEQRRRRIAEAEAYQKYEEAERRRLGDKEYFRQQAERFKREQEAGGPRKYRGGALGADYDPEHETALDILHSELRKRGSEIFYQQPQTTSITHGQASEWLSSPYPMKVDKTVKDSGDTARLHKKFERKLNAIVAKATPPELYDSMQDVVIEGARRLSEFFVSTSYKSLVSDALISEMQKRGNEILTEVDGAAETSFFAAQRLKKGSTSDLHEPCYQVAHQLSKKLDDVIRARPMPRKLTMTMKEHVQEASSYLSSLVTKPDDQIEAYIALLDEMETASDAPLIEGGIPKTYKEAAAYLRQLTSFEDKIRRPNATLQSAVQNKLKKLMSNVTPSGYSPAVMDKVIADSAKLLVSYVMLQGEKTQALKILVQEIKKAGDGVLLRHGSLRKCFKEGAELLQGKNADHLGVTSADPVVTRKIQIKLNNLMQDNTPERYLELMNDVIEDVTMYLAVHLLQPQVIQVCKCYKNVFVQCELWCDEMLRRVARPCCTCSRHVSAQALQDFPLPHHAHMPPGNSRNFAPGFDISFITCPAKRPRQGDKEPPKECPAANPTPGCLAGGPTTSYLLYSTSHKRFGYDSIQPSPAGSSNSPTKSNESSSSPVQLSKRSSPLKSLLHDIHSDNAQFLQQQEEQLQSFEAKKRKVSEELPHEYYSSGSTFLSGTSKDAQSSVTQEHAMLSNYLATETSKISQAKSAYSSRTPIISTDQMADWHAMMVSLMWNVQAWRDWIQEIVDRAVTYEHKPREQTTDTWSLFQRRVCTEALQWRQYSVFIRQLTKRLHLRYRDKEIMSPKRTTVKTKTYIECQEEMLEIIEMFNRWTQWLNLVVKESDTLRDTPNAAFPIHQKRWCHLKTKVEEYSKDWNKYNKYLKVSWEQKYSAVIEDYLPAWNTPGPVWVVSACGAVPSGAVAAGVYDGEVIWVARTTHRCNVLPAALYPSKHCCMVYAEGAVHRYTKYQVMCNAEVRWVAWRGGSIGGRAVKVASGVHVGRVHYRGDHLLGAVHEPHYRCHVVIFGRPFAFNCYELLMLADEDE